MTNDTNWANETLSYMIYMANAWSQTECMIIFGNMLGDHIWNKYVHYVNDYGTYGAMSKLVFELDNNNLKKLIDHACSKYNGRKNR